MLDTVLVVRDFVDYDPGKSMVLKDWAPAAFLDVTGRPLKANVGGSADLRDVRAYARPAPALPGSDTRRSGPGDVQLLSRNPGGW